ncbi:hypothetical protein AL1T_22540 [Acinetobacter lwoffii]|nr:hypothetical protein AL1T_22540 [Acinetobacter lwoffii]
MPREIAQLRLKAVKKDIFIVFEPLCSSHKILQNIVVIFTVKIMNFLSALFMIKSRTASASRL